MPLFVNDGQDPLAAGDHGITARQNSGAATTKRPQYNFIEGTNVTIGVVDDGGEDEIEVTIGTTAITTSQHSTIDHFGINGVGAVIKMEHLSTLSDLSSTAIVPDDDTPPTDSETGSALTLNYSPLKSAGTQLFVLGKAQLGRNGPSICMIGLRLNAETNLRSVSRTRVTDSLSMRDASVIYDYAHGTLTTQAWNLRFAQITNAGTMYINRTGTAAVGGNTHLTSVTVMEYAV